jgi:hypothetical protein
MPIHAGQTTNFSGTLNFPQPIRSVRYGYRDQQSAPGRHTKHSRHNPTDAAAFDQHLRSKTRCLQAKPSCPVTRSAGMCQRRSRG